MGLWRLIEESGVSSQESGVRSWSLELELERGGEILIGVRN